VESSKDWSIWDDANFSAVSADRFSPISTRPVEVPVDESAAFTTAYDAYRTGADALVLRLGYRVPATPGGHRIATDVAHAALQSSSDAFAPTSAERFRQGRHESEYFDPARPIDKTEGDTRWAIELATAALAAVETELSAG